MTYFTVKVKDIPAELKLKGAGDTGNTIEIIKYLEKTYNAEFVQAFPDLAYVIMRKRITYGSFGIEYGGKGEVVTIDELEKRRQ
jgi:hypothetical protein